MFISWLGISQPALNNWYDLGRVQSGFGYVHVTDSCYYLLGVEASDVVANTWDQAFVKMDFNGNVLFNHYIHSDTNETNPYHSNLLATHQGTFVTLGKYDESFLFTEYHPDGYVLDSVVIDTFFNSLGRQFNGTCRIFQNTDSSYSCFSSISDLGAFYITYVHFSQSFEILDYNFIATNSGYPIMRMCDVIKETDGFLISGYVYKNELFNEDDRSRTLFVKTDFNGIEQWRWTDVNTEYRSEQKALNKTVDGGYLYAGSRGFFRNNGHTFLPTITKLNSNLEIEWEIEVDVADSAALSLTTCHDIIAKSDDRFIGIGNFWADSMVVGFLIEFDLQGNVIWDSHFNFVDPTQPNYPKHWLYDVKETPDQGYICVGTAYDVQNYVDTGDPTSYGWVIKTDSVGCLVPGCQDFLSQDKPQGFELELYPNPASDYMYVKTSQHIEGNIQIFDMTGKIVLEWKAQPYNMSYIVDVSTLDPGNYILKAESDHIEAQRFVMVR